MISDEEFNSMLNGPLAHPFPMFGISRLAIALRIVVQAGGEPAEQALREHCRQRTDRDESMGEDS